MASEYNNLSSHSMTTPAEVLELARSYQGQPVPAKKKKPCGCNKRKKWLNDRVPGLGTALEWFFTVTGVKRLVDWYHQ